MRNAVKPGFLGVLTRWNRGFMPSAGGGEGRRASEGAGEVEDGGLGVPAAVGGPDADVVDRGVIRLAVRPDHGYWLCHSLTIVREWSEA